MDTIKLTEQEIKGIKARREQAAIAEAMLQNYLSGIFDSRGLSGNFTIDEKTWIIIPTPPAAAQIKNGE